MLENRLSGMKEKGGLIEDSEKEGVLEQLVNDILEAYSKDPDIKNLPAKVN